MIGIGNYIGKVPNQQGGSQSWESYLYGQSDLNLWVKSNTRIGTTLPNSLGGDSVTILPMICKKSYNTRYAETNITANNNCLWIVRGRFLTDTASQIQGAYVSGQNTRFYFGSDASKKWRFGWGDASGLSSLAGAIDQNWHAFIMYDKRMWIVDPTTNLSDSSILNIIATITPTVNNTTASWSGTAGTVMIGGIVGTAMSAYFEYALSYIGSITDNVITWSRKYILYGTRIQDVINADTNIAWNIETNINEAFSIYGSDHMIENGYMFYRAYAATSFPIFIPKLIGGTANPLSSPPAGYYLADSIDGDSLNYNLAPAYINIPYDNFDKSDTTIWEDIVRSSAYYDASHPYWWREEELSRWDLKRKAKVDYDNIVFTKNSSKKLSEIISYNNNISEQSNVNKVLSYIGKDYYNNKIGFDAEYETDDIEYKYSTKQWFYQNGDKVFTFNSYGFIFYSEDGGLTFPYIYEFDDSANIQMCFIFANSTILFATRTRIYYSTNKLSTITEYKVKDTNGSDYVIHTPVSANYPGSYFSIVQNFDSFTINGKEIFIWGNYANSIMKSGASPANIYYSIDGGCPKVAYKFGVNPSYRDDGTTYGGAVGNDLGDASNPLYCRHIHSVAYNSDLNEFYVCSGDTANECHWIKGTYNWNNDMWTWTNIIINQSAATRWKTGCMIYNSADGYIYFTSDSTEVPYDYGLFKVLPADIGNSGACATLVVFDNTSASFFINGTELCGRSAVEGDFIFYSKDLINISTVLLTKPDGNRDSIVGIACNKNNDGYYKFNVAAGADLSAYGNCVAVLIKFK